MKKFYVFIICIVLMCAMPIVVSAEDVVEEIGGVEDIPFEVVTLSQEELKELLGDLYYEYFPPEADTTIPTPETDTTISVPNTEPTPEEQAKTTTEKIVAWVMDKLEEISVILTLILTLFYQVRKHASLNKSIGTLNNNAVTIAENSKTSIDTALAEVQAASSTVDSYKAEMALLLAEVRENAQTKQTLEQTLNEVHAHLKTAKLANVELANEVAELLVLANIPNSKKEELYSRHLAAVGAIADADKTEVKEDVEQTE